VLSHTDLIRVTAQFGAAEQQVRRDHLIAHLLRALDVLDAPVVFFGGTALAWTLLPDGRLSEDIDLYAPDRAAVAVRLENELPRLVRRDFPGVEWDPPLSATRPVEPATVKAGDIVVRVQLLCGREYHDLASMPTVRCELRTRYADVPPTSLVCPTPAAFVATKVSAWHDRATPRDLYDLAALARAEVIDAEAATLAHRLMGMRVQPFLFQRPPAESTWRAQLAHQTRDLADPATCLAQVRAAFGAVLGWDG
jgi:predicted nucleotidyltransferase component of viral defense system